VEHICFQGETAQALLRNIAAPNLERIFLDGFRYGNVEDVLQDISQRSPDIQSITLTEIPLEESVFRWQLGGEAITLTERPPREGVSVQMVIRGKSDEHTETTIRFCLFESWKSS
jgi:hypothetical protein